MSGMFHLPSGRAEVDGGGWRWKNAWDERVSDATKT